MGACTCDRTPLLKRPPSTNSTILNYVHILLWPALITCTTFFLIMNWNTSFSEFYSQTMGCNITLQYLGYCTPLSNRERFSSLLFSYSMLKNPTISKLVYNWKQYLPYSQLLSVTYMEFLTYSAACIFTFFLNLIFFLWPLFIFCELSIQIISIFI